MRAARRAVERLGLRTQRGDHEGKAEREGKGEAKGEGKGEGKGVALGGMWLTPALRATLHAMRADLGAGRFAGYHP